MGALESLVEEFKEYYKIWPKERLVLELDVVEGEVKHWRQAYKLRSDAFSAKPSLVNWERLETTSRVLQEKVAQNLALISLIVGK